MGAEPEPGAREQEVGGRSTVGGRNLPVAIAVGLGLAGLFLGSLFWHPAAFSAVVAALALTAYLESDRVLRSIGLRVETPVLIVATLVMLFGAYRAGQTGQAIGIAVLVLGGVVWQLSDPSRTDVARRLSMTWLFGLWVGFLASFGVLLVTRPDDGVLAVLAVIGAVVLTDIGGFAFGVTLGRHHIAPSISPNKTWEGLIGGLAVAVAGGVVVLPMLGETFDMVSAAGLALTCGLAGFVGDLAESMLKRDLGVKDLGQVLPGHGGILDRVDGIIFALPVGYYAVELLA
jgi:phosphatidate cytidylyltransferase